MGSFFDDIRKFAETSEAMEFVGIVGLVFVGTSFICITFRAFVASVWFFIRMGAFMMVFTVLFD